MTRENEPSEPPKTIDQAVQSAGVLFMVIAPCDFQASVSLTISSGIAKAPRASVGDGQLT